MSKHQTLDPFGFDGGPPRRAPSRDLRGVDVPVRASCRVPVNYAKGLIYAAPGPDAFSNLYFACTRNLKSSKDEARCICMDPPV
jgi:hypothetical protein